MQTSVIRDVDIGRLREARLSDRSRGSLIYLLAVVLSKRRKVAEGIFGISFARWCHKVRRRGSHGGLVGGEEAWSIPWRLEALFFGQFSSIVEGDG